MAYDVYGNVKVLYNPSGDSSQWHIACSTGTEGLDYGDYSIYGNPYFFTGRRLDNETGLYYYRARYYNPNIGRFMQTDPIGYADGINWYAYCGNNPVMFFDPMGLCSGDSGNYAKRMLGGFGNAYVDDVISNITPVLENFGNPNAAMQSQMSDMLLGLTRSALSPKQTYQTIKSDIESIPEFVSSP